MADLNANKVVDVGDVIKEFDAIFKKNPPIDLTCSDNNTFPCDAKYKTDQKVSGAKIVKNISEFIISQRKVTITYRSELIEIANCMREKKKYDYGYIFNLAMSEVSSISDQDVGGKDYKDYKDYMFDLAGSTSYRLRFLQGILQFFGKATDINDIRGKLKEGEELNRRLVLTPSFERHSIKGNYIINGDVKSLWGDGPRIHCIICRPCEFLHYKKCAERGFVVISMPQDEEGVGSARFWCLVVAWLFKVDWALMIDDSISNEFPIRLKEGYHFSGDYKSHSSKNNPDQYKALGAVMFIEQLIQRLIDDKRDGNFGVIGLRRYSQFNRNSQNAVIKFNQGFQYINVKQAFLKQVYFRRGLFNKEDLVFCQECLSKGLLPVCLTYVQYYDQSQGLIQRTGAHSPNSANNATAILGAIDANELPSDTEQSADLDSISSNLFASGASDSSDVANSFAGLTMNEN
jgi:hypothetical protein